MLSLAMFVILLGVLIFVHELGHFLTAKRAGVRVERFSLGFGPILLSRTVNGTCYSLCAVPLGGFVKMAGDVAEEFKGNKDEYYAQPVFKRALIVFCGPLMNYITGILCFILVFWIGYPSFSGKVGQVLDGYGAKEAGIAVGDVIVSIDGQKTPYWEDIQRMMRLKQSAKSVRVAVARGGSELLLDVQVGRRPADLSAGKAAAFLGVSPSEETTVLKRGFIESVRQGFLRSAELTVFTYKAFWWMITGKLSLRDSVTGPVGIFVITSKAVSAGVSAVLSLAAVLSLSLAIFNLLPFPVLDGGHLAFLLLEKFRGRPLSNRAEGIVGNIGMYTLIVMAVFVTYNDILRFFGDRIRHIFH